MKKYIVMKRIGSFGAKEERQFNNLDDARMYKNLCAANEDCEYVEYFVVEVLE